MVEVVWGNEGVGREFDTTVLMFGARNLFSFFLIWFMGNGVRALLGVGRYTIPFAVVWM